MLRNAQCVDFFVLCDCVLSGGNVGISLVCRLNLARREQSCQFFAKMKWLRSYVDKIEVMPRTKSHVAPAVDVVKLSHAGNNGGGGGAGGGAGGDGGGDADDGDIHPDSGDDDDDDGDTSTSGDGPVSKAAAKTTMLADKQALVAAGLVRSAAEVEFIYPSTQALRGKHLLVRVCVLWAVDAIVHCV